MENLQLISAEANGRKGAFEFIPRKWQKRFQHGWEEHTPGVPFLLVAIPAGGKTFAALQAVSKWMDAGSDRRVIVVVPTVNLQEQWRDEAVNFGIELQTKEFGLNFKDGFQGTVVTYQWVAAGLNGLLLKKLCSSAPTMVVFDEVHHCGDEASFGLAVKEAFSSAKELLLLSGTPWKTDGTYIPFVRYDKGHAVADYTYGRTEALNDHIIREVVFDYHKGTIHNDITGVTEQVSEDNSDEEAEKRLRRILDPGGDYMRGVIASAYRKLMELRKARPDAAALVVCIDQEHASRVAQVIREETRCEPSVIVSDNDRTNDNVRAFRNGNTEWLVTVRRVSEGTDIKRLQVLLYLTTTCTDIFFQQVIGRVSRVRDPEDFEAFVFLPSDPRLIRCAQNIEALQVQAIREQHEEDLRELGERDRPLALDMYSTRHGGTEVKMIGNERISLEEMTRAERVAESVDVPILKVLEIYSQMSQGQPSEPHQPHTTDTPLEIQEDELRLKCNRLVNRLVRVTGKEYWEIHGGWPKQKEMTVPQLQSKLGSLLEEYDRQTKCLI